MDSASGQSIPKKTEFFSGPEATTAAAVSWLSRIKERIDIVMGPQGPSVVIGYEPLRNEHLRMRERGVKGRWVTEITKDNLPYCKEAMEKFDIEIRHLDGTKGPGFAVSEKEYAESGALEATKPIPELITSTMGAIREQHQFLFDILWSKAIPAELKRKEIEEGIKPEKTEFFYGAEATTIEAVSFLARIRKSYDVVVDTNAASVVIEIESFKNAYVSMKERGVKMRSVTEMTKDNVKYCKEVMNSLGVEIRHLDGIKGNFGVSESEYIAAATLEEAKPVPILMTSTVKAFREQQQYVFHTLWNKAIPAEHRIREIEEGIPIERTEAISDPPAIETIYQHIISEAREEILLILSTVNAFVRHKKLGILDLLKKQQSEKGLKIRLLVPVTEDKKNEQDILDLETHGVQVNRLSHNPPQKKTEKVEERSSTRVTVVIVDKMTSLVIELEDDERANFDDAIGTAVLSTGKSLASSYVRIFESLWQETKLTARLAESDKLQKEFINIAAHELRSPITPILTALYLAEKIKKPDGTSQTILSESEAEMIQRNAKRLEKLATDILTVSNIEAKGIHLQKERGSLDDWISEELSTAKAFVPSDTKIDFVFKPASRDSSLLLLIDADKSKILEVLSNLIRNAIKFSPKGGKITVTTSRSEDEKSAIVKIHDTGGGIDPEIYPRLFQKFASSYVYGATGLGLYISQRIVEAHGGKIWAENNKDDMGATFTFTIPLMDPKLTGF